MESIMNYLYEYEKYYRRSPINFFHSICFLFENEKTNWEWNEIEGHCGIDGRVGLPFFFFVVGYRRLAAHLPRQKSATTNSSQQLSLLLLHQIKDKLTSPINKTNWIESKDWLIDWERGVEWMIDWDANL